MYRDVMFVSFKLEETVSSNINLFERLRKHVILIATFKLFWCFIDNGRGAQIWNRDRVPFDILLGDFVAPRRRKIFLRDLSAALLTLFLYLFDS